MTKESSKSLLACHKKTKVSLLTAFLFLSISYILCASAEAALCYVKYDALGANNGTSWTNAYTDLQSALGNISCTEIWVAAGTYMPSGAGRSSTFQLKNGVAVYGGFIGTETTLGQRNPATNVTILSCDIGTVGVNTDNCRHVVNGSGTNSTAILDGFTITLGNADSISFDGAGGGMINGRLHVPGSPTLVNLIFSNNSALDYGGGMANFNSSNPTLTNVTFSGNRASNGGGGMYNDVSNPTLTNVTFSGNRAASSGGGMYNYGSSPTLTNVTFSGNNAVSGLGGGVYNSSSATPTLWYATFSGNTGGSGGGGIYSFIAGTTCNSCILWGNTGGEIAGPPHTVTYSIVQGGYAGTGNSSLDPLLGILGNYGGYTQTIPLLSGSPAINTIPMGTNGCGTTITTDQRGVIRPQGSGCDMGAYEFSPPVAIPTMNEWGMIIFTVLAGLGSVYYLRRQRSV